MQLCLFDGASSYFAVRALDFIAGYPAKEGKLTNYPNELGDIGECDDKQWQGRIRCFGYAIAHAVCIPISPLVALVRIVAMPIFYRIVVKSLKPEERPRASKLLRNEWFNECAGVITSPLLNAAGVVRAASGIIKPSLYLKASPISTLSEAQQKQAANFHNTIA